MIKHNIKKLYVILGLLIMVTFIVIIYRNIYNIPKEENIKSYVENSQHSKIFKRNTISIEDRKIVTFNSDKSLISCEYLTGIGGRCKILSITSKSPSSITSNIISAKKNYYLIIYGVNPNNIIDNIKVKRYNKIYNIKVPKGEYFLVSQRVEPKYYTLGHFTLFDKNNNQIQDRMIPNSMDEIYKKFHCIKRSDCDITIKEMSRKNYINFLCKTYNYSKDEAVKLNSIIKKSSKDIKTYNYSKASIKYKVCDKVYINLSVPLKSYIDDKNCLHYIWCGKVFHNTLNDNYKFEPFSIDTLIENEKPVLRGRGAIYVKVDEKLNISPSDLKDLGFTKEFKNYYYKIFNIDCKLCE